MYLQGQYVDQDLQTAYQLIKTAADQNLPDALNELGGMYGKGIGVEANRGISITYYEQAAELNHPLAIFNLGVIFINADGVERDIEKGVSYFVRGAELGDEECKVILARLAKEHGIGPGADVILQ